MVVFRLLLLLLRWKTRFTPHSPESVHDTIQRRSRRSTGTTTSYIFFSRQQNMLQLFEHVLYTLLVLDALLSVLMGFGAFVLPLMITFVDDGSCVVVVINVVMMSRRR